MKAITPIVVITVSSVAFAELFGFSYDAGLFGAILGVGLYLAELIESK